MSSKEIVFIDEKLFLSEAKLFGNSLMKDIANVFLSQYKGTLEAIISFIQDECLIEAGNKIHKLASSVAPFHATGVFDFAKDLEIKIKNEQKEKSDIMADYIELKHLVVKMASELETLIDRL